MSSALVWFRRDLRDSDHAALSAALHTAERVHCVFVFDRAILDALPTRRDRRVAFIRASLIELDTALRTRGGGLIVLHDRAEKAIPELARALGVAQVFCNRDYEPAARMRDHRVADALAKHGIDFHGLKDQVVFDTDEVVSRNGRPYAVYTPYRNAWLARLSAADWAAHDTVDARGRLAAPSADHGRGVPPLAAVGFEECEVGVATGMRGARAALDRFLVHLDAYADERDFPARAGTSRLSVHLRFGTISGRELLRIAQERVTAGSAGAQAWRNELVWREFYSQLLWHHPRVVDGPFRAEFARVEYRDDDAGFTAWREGRTGYPLIDAAMRELAATGWMHNRLRMVTASFLAKDLLIDWRRGERWFAEQLLDYELASNNGGWQWAASTGCDAQPWFRIFNPVTQSERFDADGAYIRRWVPELDALDAREIHAPWQVPELVLQGKDVRLGTTYPRPIVDHKSARQRALEAYGRVKG